MKRNVSTECDVCLQPWHDHLFGMWCRRRAMPAIPERQADTRALIMLGAIWLRDRYGITINQLNDIEQHRLWQWIEAEWLQTQPPCRAPRSLGDGLQWQSPGAQEVATDRNDPRHGRPIGYQYGCRCQPCRQAIADTRDDE